MSTIQLARKAALKRHNGQAITAQEEATLRLALALYGPETVYMDGELFA